MPKGPGLAKVNKPPLLARKSIDLVAPHAGRWREIVEAADVVSEGQAREEGGAAYWYGTTSLLLSTAGELAEEDLEELAGILRYDPHIRLRVVRVARREAVSRASAALGPMKAEVLVRATAEGLVVTVDVVARLRRTGSSVGGASR
jgi:hypothetical protein